MNPRMLFVLGMVASCGLVGCYRSHRIGEDDVGVDGDPPPRCWAATDGPTFLTEARHRAYAGSLLAVGDDLLLGYASTNRGELPLPRTVLHLDDHGRTRAEERVLDVPERQIGPALELVDTSLGVVATSYGEGRGCELRVLGEDPVTITPEYCAKPRTSPAGGFITILGGIGPRIVDRRFAHLSGTHPLRVVEGPRGVLGDAWSKTYEPLDRDHVLVVMADRDGGLIEGGILEWRTGESRVAPIHEAANDVRRFRLLPRGEGWLFGWIEEVDEGLWRLALMPLDAEGSPTAPPAYPDVGALPETGWQMVDRAGELVIVYTDGAELRMATVNERLGLGASASTVAELEGLDDVQAVVLADGAVLVTFTAFTGVAERVGSLRAECL